MKRIIITISLICVFLTNMQGQVDRSLKFTIEQQFFSSWLYFRLTKNPMFSEEIRNPPRGEMRRPWQHLLPPEYTYDYQPDIKILPWYDESLNSGLGFEFFGYTDGLYIIEKGDGITGVKSEFNVSILERIPVDTMHVNVYDSIFPFDNRFLVYVSNSGEIGFYSGNIGWDNWRNLNMSRGLVGVAYIRGVQFGLQRLRRMPDEWITGVRENLPQYDGWDFAFADRSFLTYGRLLITAPPNQAPDHLEFLFYSDHPQKTGDEEGVYYEFRYILPTIINDISERRLEKRKLTPEEVQKMRETDLRYFVDPWQRWEVIIEIEEEME